MRKHLKSHENAHLRWDRNTSDKPFKCSFPNCTRSFTVKSSLQNHIATHQHGRGGTDISAHSRYDNDSRKDIDDDEDYDEDDDAIGDDVQNDIDDNEENDDDEEYVDDNDKKFSQSNKLNVSHQVTANSKVDSTAVADVKLNGSNSNQANVGLRRKSNSEGLL